MTDSEVGLTHAKIPKERILRLSVPSIVTSVRLVLFPILIFYLINGQIFLADSLFVIAIASDLADGYLARKLCVPSKFGGIFDAVVDFVFIGGIFLYFAASGVFPVWMFLLVVFMFLQFVATSALVGTVYDPLGKYYGSLLYGAVGLTFLFSSALAVNAICLATVGVTIACLLSRLIFLAKKNL
jgi:phosphatidylglycerophosphate synthase